ncbi:hypothetical protein EVAR_41798_1 [Eumeta japonica]|uniref:Uncharacterized protein n=1 Tax=Eumeta variegata TaxID=151549 RepID=A0A4C1VYP4_EUMVA|nr:hypothetical protein EVAR_41798_1 [Eumeta japonica]
MQMTTFIRKISFGAELEIFRNTEVSSVNPCSIIDNHSSFRKQLYHVSEDRSRIIRIEEHESSRALRRRRASAVVQRIKQIMKQGKLLDWDAADSGGNPIHYSRSGQLKELFMLRCPRPHRFTRHSTWTRSAPTQ